MSCWVYCHLNADVERSQMSLEFRERPGLEI